MHEKQRIQRPKTTVGGNKFCLFTHWINFVACEKQVVWGQGGSGGTLTGTRTDLTTRWHQWVNADREDRWKTSLCHVCSPPTTNKNRQQVKMGWKVSEMSGVHPTRERVESEEHPQCMFTGGWILDQDWLPNRDATKHADGVPPFQILFSRTKGGKTVRTEESKCVVWTQWAGPLMQYQKVCLRVCVRVCVNVRGLGRRDLSSIYRHGERESQCECTCAREYSCHAEGRVPHFTSTRQEQRTESVAANRSCRSFVSAPLHRRSTGGATSQDVSDPKLHCVNEGAVCVMDFSSVNKCFGRVCVPLTSKQSFINTAELRLWVNR